MTAFRIVETNERVGIGEPLPPVLRTRFRWRADRYRRRHAARSRGMGMFRYEVVKADDGRYEVVAMLNRAVPK